MIRDRKWGILIDTHTLNREFRGRTDDYWGEEYDGDINDEQAVQELEIRMGNIIADAAREAFYCACSDLEDITEFLNRE